MVTKEDSEEELRAIALETIETRYSNHLCIYTDGSKVKDATSAAMVIPGIPHEESWRLDYGETRSIMMAEMYAIMKSMTWLAINSPLLDSNEAVILTDSRSGIEALNSPNPGNQSSLSNTILNIAETLADHISITIQWLPAHGRHSRSPRSGLRYRIWSNQATFRLVTLNPYSLRNLRVS